MMRGLLALAVCGALLVAAPPASAAPTKDECMSAAEQSQPLRRDRKLRTARERLVVCSQAECPAFVRSDCISWLSEVDRALPSVVVRAVDRAGADVANVRVFIDGDAVKAADGAEIFVDPGSHTFRFEHAGDPLVTQQVIVREGERHRALSVTFGAAATGAKPASTTETPRSDDHPSRALPIALMIGGAASLLAASYFWITGLGDRSTMESGCAQNHSCDSSSVSSARTKLIVGDVLGALGIVLGAGGVYFFVSPPAANSAAATNRVPLGASLGIGGTL